MYKIQYRCNSNSAWTDCIWAGRFLTFKDKNEATEILNKIQAIVKQISLQYEYKVVEMA